MSVVPSLSKVGWLALKSIGVSNLAFSNTQLGTYVHFYLFCSTLTKYVEPHQCPLHQFILPTQGPINEIFAKT